MKSDSSEAVTERLSSTDVPRLREMHKADKRRRISLAAKRLFSLHGYEATTLRQIAREAGVALGTLSLYADDKRDLVLMIFNQKIQVLNDRAEAASRRRGKFLNRLVSMFRVYAEDAAADMIFARIHHQLSYYSGGSHSQEYYAYRAQLFAVVEQLVREAKANGEIAATEDPAFIARQIFFTFSACLRWWVASQNPKLEDCIRDLTRALQFQIDGMRPMARRTARNGSSTRARQIGKAKMRI